MELTELHYKAMRLMIEGKTVPQVAEEFGMAAGTIYRWRTEPEFKAELELIRKAINEQVGDLIGTRLAEEAPMSLDTIIAMRDGAKGRPGEKVRLDAARDLLDRAGFKAVDRGIITHEHTLTPEFAELIKRTQEDARTIDATVVHGLTELPERRIGT